MSNIRKYIQEIIKESFNETNNINKYLIEGRYLFHYTLTEYLDEILKEGLIPRKNPNSYYNNGSKGIFLTTSYSLYKANLPQSLIDIMGEYYENEDSYDNKPLVRLWVDISKLDTNKLTWDDDYVLNKYGWNKAINNTEKVIESLDIWGSVAYIGNISKNAIVKYDFNYSN